jgi:hypothetical protein
VEPAVNVEVVCTGRHTHPQTTAVAESLHPLPPYERDPALSDYAAIRREIDRPAPRRKRPKNTVVYRCPICGEHRRLGGRRTGRLMSLSFALGDIEGLGKLPVDISFME